jgi:hypothetical protein
MVGVVTIYENGLIRALQTDGEHWNKRVAEEVMALAIAECPSTSGHLAACHGIEQNRVHGSWATGWNVYNDATVFDKNTGEEKPLALFIHNGTQGPIVPVHTEKRKYLHLPPYMGFRWSSSFKLATPRKRKKGVRGPYVRTFDPTDPYGHAESASGTREQPWLREAGYTVSRRHG